MTEEDPGSSDPRVGRSSGSSDRASGETRGGGNGKFPVTRWSLVLAAGDQGTGEAGAALEVLCQRYWLPVYVSIRGSGRGPEEAEDLTQDFFAMLLRRSVLEKPTPERGRFRTFLLTALERFLIDDWRQRTTQKRGRGEPLISIDRELGDRHYEIVASGHDRPDRLFEQQWARELLGRTLRQLEEIFESEGKGRQFAVLRPHLAAQGRTGAYEEISRELGVSEVNARTLLFRFRQRFRRLLREEIAETVADEASVDDEIRYMFRLFSG